MNITVIGRGRVGGGLARKWTEAGHLVTALGQPGGDASDADVVVVAVPGQAIADALAAVKGLTGKVTIDACNLYQARDDRFHSLSHQIQTIVEGPTAKSFNTNFAAAYDMITSRTTRPSNLYAADADAKDSTEQLIRDAGYDPVFIGELHPGARLLEDSSGLTRALAQQIGPFFYRYATPSEF